MSAYTLLVNVNIFDKIFDDIFPKLPLNFVHNLSNFRLELRSGLYTLSPSENPNEKSLMVSNRSILVAKSRDIRRAGNLVYNNYIVPVALRFVKAKCHPRPFRPIQAIKKWLTCSDKEDH